MKSKHTPGPWHITTNPHDETDGAFYIVDEAGSLVAKVETDCSQKDEANSRILATAHELLEALRGCRDMLRESAKQFRQLGDGGHAVMADRHADKADEIIAKAQ